MNIISTLLAALCFIAVSSGVSAAHDYKAGAINIHHPAVRAMPPGASVGGGAMSITNTGSEADRLVAVSAAVAKTVQLHEMRMEGDVMVMRQLDNGIEIPAGATVVLKPGATHLMFMGVTRPFVEGEAIAATLQFEKAGPVAVEFTVGPVNGPDEPVHHN